MSQGNLSLYAAGSVAFPAGAPTWVWHSGEFTGVITDTGAGDCQLLMNAAQGIDAAECAVLLSVRGAVANWPRGVSCNCVHTSDISKQILLAQEGAAAGADAAADVAFDIVIVKYGLL